MRLLVIFSAAMAMIACSSTPRVGEDSGADYPIQIKEGSSKALGALNKAGITGVRDLSLSEFEDEAEDYKKFQSLNAAGREGGNSTAYAATSSAIGSGLGLTMDFAGGLALLGKLAADDRPLNYDFADDFRSSYALYSPQNKETFMKELSVNIPEALKSFNLIIHNRFGASIDDDIHSIYIPAHSEGERHGIDLGVAAFDAVGRIGQDLGSGKRTHAEFYFSARCPDAGIEKGTFCDLVVRFRIKRVHNPNVAILLDEIAKALPQGAIMYAPPRRDVYQLPGVYLAGGEHLLLVEGK